MIRRLGGVGLGLRWDFIDDLIDRADALAGGRLPVDFLEISPENTMLRGGKIPAQVARLAETLPILTHGLTMSIAGTDPLDDGYFEDLAPVLTTLRPPWHSDHLCVSRIAGRSVHDLLPVPYHRASVVRIADRIRWAQDKLGLPIAIENISHYLHPGRPDMPEPEFLARVCETADCSLLLDVNNVYVNAANFGFDPDAWMRSIPLHRVVEIHVAGHEWFSVDERGLGEPRPPATRGAIPIDTHGAEVADDVLALLERVVTMTGPVPVLLERDQNVPSLDALFGEVDRVRRVYDRATFLARSHDDAAVGEV